LNDASLVTPAPDDQEGDVPEGRIDLPADLDEKGVEIDMENPDGHDEKVVV